MRIEWKRIQRQGFVAAHWVGIDSQRREWSIWANPRYRSQKGAGCYLNHPNRRRSDYGSTAEAKKDAELLASTL